MLRIPDFAVSARLHRVSTDHETKIAFKDRAGREIYALTVPSMGGQLDVAQPILISNDAVSYEIRGQSGDRLVFERVK